MWVWFPARGLGVAFFAIRPDWVLKCISFWHSNLSYLKNFRLYFGCQCERVHYYKMEHIFFAFSIVPTAFFYTTLIFICFTVSALWAEERSFLYLGGKGCIMYKCNLFFSVYFGFPKLFFLKGMLASGVTILLVTTILNIFMRSYFLYQVQNLYFLYCTNFAIDLVWKSNRCECCLYIFCLQLTSVLKHQLLGWKGLITV